jgi:hypothetical protein
MSKTLATLRTALGSMIGFPTVTDLPDDEQTAIDTILNAAYLECYAERGGKRPRWIEQYVSDIVKTPAAVTLGLTNGSKTVTGFSFEAKYAGSFVKIGDAFYRYGGTASAVHSLVQPWAGDTGSYAATVYYNAFALPGTVIEVCEMPSILGVGPLTPLPFPESELALRSAPAFDFEPRAARAPFAYSRPRFNPSVITDVGDPMYFHVDSASTGATFATGSRFHLYPIPAAAATIELRADVVPAELTTGADVPMFPNAGTVDVAGAVLLPIAYDLLLKHPLGRRYTGNNAQLIMAGAAAARTQLGTTFARVQRRTMKQARTAAGW